MPVNDSGRSVIDAIERAFPIKNPPTKVTPDLTHPEHVEVSADFLGKAWTEMPQASLEYNWEALNFLTPEAFRYYLPAYMRASLLDPDSNIFQGAMFALELSKINPEWTLDRFAGLTKLQREAILRFLRFLHEHYREDHFPFGESQQAVELWERLQLDADKKGE